MAGKNVCLVTGGVSGIGLAAATELLAQGWRVALFDVQAEKLAATQAELGADCDARCVSVTDAGRIKDAVEHIERDFGPIMGVVNSAGIARDVPCLDTEPELFRTILDVNVVGSFIVAQAAARAMVQAERGGAIVNVASISGMRGNIGRVAYGASKGAVITMTKVMAVELAARGIRVNAVAPGPVDTPMVQEMHGEEIRRLWLRAIPQRRYASPSEIAPAIAFLLDGAKSSFITGQILAVDGGFDAGGLLPDR